MLLTAPEPIRDVVILRIAEGGMGYIELVARRQGRFSRLFARKRLLPALRVDPGFRAMFFDEARLAGLIRHPNVAAALEVGEDADGPFLIMDYVDGPSVAQIIERVEPRERLLPVAFCVSVAAQAARGLQAAHALVGADGSALRVVHRDISPKNLLVGFDGLVRVVDFGIAKASDNIDQTRLGVLKGSVGYMAPEYLRFHEVDGRSDLFALGVVLYEMLTRERLYGGVETSAIARRIIEEPPPDIFDARDVPPELAGLLFELMAKEPELRPPDALTLAARLDDIANGLAADQGPFDVSAFLQSELAAMREERQALVESALAGAGTTPAPAATRPALDATLETSAPHGETADETKTSAERPRVRARWRRRGPIAAALLLVLALVSGIAVRAARHRARATAFLAGHGALWSGGWHSCALRADHLLCWGNNVKAQLGDGTQESRSLPVDAPIAAPRDLALGEYHTCALRADERVVCWGRNVRGEVGQPASLTSTVPVEVPGVAGAQAIVAGRQHTCALLVGGVVVCWGANESGQLGRPASPEAGPPAEVPGLPRVAQIFAGGSNTCAQAAGGPLQCWGANESGQLRDGTLVARPAPAPVPGVAGIARVAIGNRGRAGSRNPDLSKNAGYMCGLTGDGRVLCWGDNDTGQLGDGTRIDRAAPTPVLGIDDAIMIDVGDVHACALRRTGRVLCWGRNEFGAVGDGTMGPSTVRPTPVEVQALADVVAIALGGAHSCARRRDGEILCWGVNNFGQLGDGSNVLWPAPHPVVGLLAQSR